MATYTVVTDDNFTRANTTAGTVTAPGTFNSPSTGAAYIDLKGSTWSISSNTLIGTNVTTADYSDAFLLRPTSENVLAGQVAVTATPGAAGAAMCAIARCNTSNKAYAAYFFFGGSPNLIIGTFGPGSGVQTQLSQSGATPFNGASTTASYILTLTFSGASPTTLQATIALASTPGTIIATVSASDSTAGLQTAGQQGLAANSASGAAPTFTRLTTSQVSASTSLAIGGLSVTSTNAGLSVNTSSALSGGSGAGFSYAIYRGTDPNAATLLTNSASLPYVDTTAVIGTEYYYGVVGTDSAANSVTALPLGVGAWSPAFTPYVAGQLHAPGLNIVFGPGDSITYGTGVSNGGTVNSPTMPYFCMARLSKLLGIRNVYGSNQGNPGKTFTDFAPGGSLYTSCKTAMTNLTTAQPNAQQVFSIMLGTNDSASSGTNNSPAGTLSPANYQTKLTALVTQLLTDFPACVVVAHMSPYYTPNTQNTSVYLQAGLSALYSYRAAHVAAINSFASSNPRQVFVGDTLAFQYFAENYLAELQGDTSGPNGTFYLHPAGTAGSNGFTGTQSLGEFHAAAIRDALYGAGQNQRSSTSSRIPVSR